ncbi:MAG: aldo/keto reductase [Promethearchaeota archaeon]
MKYRKLGRHGVKISEISMGTMFYGSYVSKQTGINCLNEAVNQGINHIDTADLYGVVDEIDMKGKKRIRAESIVGDFLKDHDRTDLVISTKVWFKMRDSVNSGGLSRKHIREGIRDSLSQLKTDYLDIYYCHRPDLDTPLEETITTMSNLIDDGLINYWGTSRWSNALIERTIGIAKELGCYPPHVEQSRYNFSEREIEKELIDLASYNGIGLITYGTLAGGIYTGKYLDNIPNDSRLAKTPRYYPKDQIDLHHSKLPQLIDLANSLELSITQLAFAWVLRHSEITSILTSATRIEHITSNVKACEVTISKNIIEQIDDIMNGSTVR